jgi:hypothetical protein
MAARQKSRIDKPTLFAQARNQCGLSTTLFFNFAELNQIHVLEISTFLMLQKLAQPLTPRA